MDIDNSLWQKRGVCQLLREVARDDMLQAIDQIREHTRSARALYRELRYELPVLGRIRALIEDLTLTLGAENVSVRRLWGGFRELSKSDRELLE